MAEVLDQVVVSTLETDTLTADVLIDVLIVMNTLELG